MLQDQRSKSQALGEESPRRGEGALPRRGLSRQVLRGVALAALSLGLAALPATPASAVDPFYASRFHEGRTAYDRGDYHEAVFSLRLACFGMLEAPRELAECLVWLAMAQAGAEDREGFATTFRRLAEGEELVGLYSDSELSPDLRRGFESRAAEWIPPATLAATPAFAELGHLREEQRLASLAPRARRAQLERLMQERPQEPRWPSLLARLELEEGRPKPALEAADRALSVAPRESASLCVRGWALARLDRCGEAVEELEHCAGRNVAFASELLRCRVAAGQWQQAQDVLAGMESSWRQTPEVAKMATEVEAQRQAPPQAPVAVAPVGTNDHPVPAAARETLERARQLAGAARSANELEQAYLLATEVVTAHPGSRSARFLAGEIAYRASRWREAIEHFRSAGAPDIEHPQLVFYLAVSLYETGEREEAAQVLRCCADRLRSTPFVDQYVRRILGGS